MKNLKLDDILDIVNEEKDKRGFDTYAPCYPMLRVIDNKLYIAVMISDLKNDIWNKDSSCKPEYWCLIDTMNHQIIEYNKTSEKDYADNIISVKSINNNELVEFENIKRDEYEKFLLEDIKRSNIPLQKEIFDILKGKIDIDGKIIDINDYVMENVDDLVKAKAHELVDLLIQSKYSLITICYDNLFNKIIDEYNKNGIIDVDKIRLCIKIMENYYYGIVGIKEFFNL